MAEAWEQIGNDGLDDNLLIEASGLGDAGKLMKSGGTLQKVGSQYTTAVKVQEPRNLQQRAKMLLAEARIAGESFYYGWGTGDNKTIGPSIGLAMAAARVWGNCAVEPGPIQDTEDSWIMPVQFIDLETGFTLGRSFRQSKKWTVYGKFDAERKDDVRFQIGQSKAARNVVCNALPKWLIDAAVKEAQTGVRDRVQKFVNENGLVPAIDAVIGGLTRAGVSEAAILEKCEVAGREGMTIDHVVMLRGDLYALQNNTDRAETLFPMLAKSDVKTPTSELNDALDGDAPPTATEPETKKRRGRPKGAKNKPKPATPEPERDADGTVIGDGMEPPPGALPGDEPAQPAGATAQSAPEPTNAPADESIAAALPDGLETALGAAQAVSQVEEIRAQFESGAETPDVFAAIGAECERRANEIRAAYRGW